ncbi:MAG TPA: hypothetical protein VK278_02830 [Gaiellaceae bacterium]|nr:hypothetical protein [Gaiellaceae bacterium]
MAGRALLVVLVVLAASSAAHASPRLRVGITDSGAALYGDGSIYPALRELRASILRVHLNWGGRAGVARRMPRDPSDPEDLAYDWRPYDRIVLAAATNGVAIVFTIFGTPPWENGGRAPTRAPRDTSELEDFSYAAATRYSGTYKRADGTVLPAVRRWTAWNEPNLRIGLYEQWRRVAGKWVAQSARDYARICNGIVLGVHATLVAGERVACGVTAARGNNNPRGEHQSVSPIVFLRAMAAAGARGFDAYAHHPYNGSMTETPSSRPRGPSAVTLGNIDVLENELARLYRRPVPLWLTEYGYQTNPPDRLFGVSPAKQAAYLAEAFAIARRDPRIDLLLWFLLRDERDVTRWQSGLVTAAGKRKPAFAAYRRAASSLPTAATPTSARP